MILGAITRDKKQNNKEKYCLIIDYGKIFLTFLLKNMETVESNIEIKIDITVDKKDKDFY